MFKTGIKSKDLKRYSGDNYSPPEIFFRKKMARLKPHFRGFIAQEPGLQLW